MDHLQVVRPVHRFLLQPADVNSLHVPELHPALRGGGYDPFAKQKDGSGGGKGMSEAERRIYDIGAKSGSCTM